MKITEVIQALESLLAEQGDIPCYVPDHETGGTSAVMDVEVGQSREEGTIIHILP